MRKIDNVTRFCSGLSFVSTASHGYFRVTERLLKRTCCNWEDVIKYAGFREGNYIYFEEDCAFALLLCEAPELLVIVSKKENKDANDFFKQCNEAARRWYPKYYDEV